jgi:Fructose-bisphosphate aldolase class-II/Stress responsive A/B Barrel Domain
MPIVNLTDLLRHARLTRAVPGVIVDDLKEYVAVLTIAKALESPLVVSVGPESFPDIGIATAAPSLERAAAASAIPVAPLLAGVREEQELVAAIRLGFCGVSVAADASTRRRVELTEIAVGCGIAIESDHLASSDHSGGHRGPDGIGWMASEGKSIDLAAHIRALRSNGRAPEFLAECRAWTPVEHVVEFNASGLDDGEVAELLDLGTKMLGSIPGVREVRTGRAAAENARYRFAWFMQFAGPMVIESFNAHPVHLAFADGHFRPVAQDRLTTNYLLRPRSDPVRWSGDE